MNDKKLSFGEPDAGNGLFKLAETTECINFAFGDLFDLFKNNHWGSSANHMPFCIAA